MNVSGFIKDVSSTERAVWVIVTILLIVYGVAPLLVYLFAEPSPYMLKLVGVTLVAVASIIAGYKAPIADFQFGPQAHRISVDSRVLNGAIWISFGVYCIFAYATADGIPLFHALFTNATETDLDRMRAGFVKGREGWEIILRYASVIFTGALLPYSLASLFVLRSNSRYYALLAFFMYAESFLQKALFLTVLLPIAYLVAQRKIWTYFGLAALIVVSAGVLVVNGRLSRGAPDALRMEQFAEGRIKAAEESAELKKAKGPKPQVPAAGKSQTAAVASKATPSQPAATPTKADIERDTRAKIAETERQLNALNEGLIPPKFFTADFRPLTTLEHLAWRILAVPIFTASDALVVLDVKFGGHHLLGATSSLLSAIFGLDRVAYDNEVFSYQWGGEGLGTANSVFTTEAYVNFGWLGVVGFAFIVGQAFRLFRLSTDDAFKAVWPVFMFLVTQAGLLGTLFSNGFLILFGLALFVRITHQPSRVSSEGIAATAASR